MNAKGKNAQIDAPSLCWFCVKINVCDFMGCVLEKKQSTLHPEFKKIVKCNKFQAILTNTGELADMLGISTKKLEAMKQKDFDRVFSDYGMSCFPDEDPETGIMKYILKIKNI